MDISHASLTFISSEGIEGAEVYDENGYNIGEVDRLMIDEASGLYAVLTLDGFLGFGHSHCRLPWAMLSYDTNLCGFRAGMSKQQLRNLPALSGDSLESRDRELRVHGPLGPLPSRGQWAPIN